MEMIEANISSLKSFRCDLYSYLSNDSLFENDPCSVRVAFDEMIWEKSVKYSEIKNCRLLIINGCISPDGVERIIDELSPGVRQILFVCHSKDQFVSELKRGDYSKWIADERFEFCIGLDEKYINAFLKEYFTTKDRLIYREKIGFFNYWPDIASHGNYYVKFAEMVPQVLAQLQSSLNAPDEDAYRGFLNLNANLSLLGSLRRIDAWKSIAKGMPAVLIASGPSLKFHLENLRQLHGKFIIGCCDSALKSVLEHGLEPHFCFSLERSASVGKLFTNVPSGIRTTLVTLPICHPSVLKNFPSDVLFMTSQIAYSQWLCSDVPVFNLGGSVATMALRFFVHLGITDVTLLGQDLAYDPVNSHSHFFGVPQEILDVEHERFNEGWCELESNSGQMIKSSAYWMMFLDEIKVFITKFSMKCKNVIPATYGARLDGTTRIDPDVFWNDVEAMNASQCLWDNATPQRQSGIPGHEYGVLLESTLSRLVVLEEIVMRYLDDMSLALLDCFPESRSQNLIAYYRHKLEQWHVIENDVLTHEIYLKLIKFIMPGSHLRFFTARENLFLEDQVFATEISRYINITQEWLKNVLCWIVRVRRTVERNEECYAVNL